MKVVKRERQTIAKQKRIERMRENGTILNFAEIPTISFRQMKGDEMELRRLVGPREQAMEDEMFVR
jgi:hypothetical protein